MRGERHLNTTGVGRANGSSPHARGTPFAGISKAVHDRFIPACAGNAAQADSRNRLSPVHPRMRGERIMSPCATRSPFGSSPHARGTRVCGGRVPQSVRFIPACAGNAPAAARGTSVPAVHPRMRGERRHLHGHNYRFHGSSPHARGTPRSRRTGVHQRRFIPACAGNAGAATNETSLMSVHPRMRGERPQNPISPMSSLGSSPHARGTRQQSVVHAFKQRFIPACAGNALWRQGGGQPLTVHPRMRGERRSASVVISGANGSSPHARGTHFQ